MASEIIPPDGCAFVKLSDGSVTLVDIVDLHLLEGRNSIEFSVSP